MAQTRLDPLLKPASLALVGASPDETKIGGRLLRTFLNAGFTGRLYPISLKAPQIMGLKAYPSLMDLPDAVDLAVLVIPAGVTEQAMVQCVRKGVKFAVIHGAGFSEIGALGKELEKKVLAVAREGRVRVVGPNCMGLFSPHVRLNTIVPGHEIPYEPGPIGFCGQSGWVCENTVYLGSHRGMRFSGVVSSGNQGDLTVIDYLDHFARDPGTRVVGAYVEGIEHGRAFLEKARRVSETKPVVIWKSGKTQAGARALASHTASMAGDYAITHAAFRQAGVVKAQNLEELHDLLIAFCCPYLPRGNRVGILVESGGGGAAAADACEPMGLQVPILAPALQKELADFTAGKIPPTSGLTNPVDVVWAPAQGTRQFWLGCMERVIDAVDVLLAILYQELADEEFISGVLQLQDRVAKPIILVPGHALAQLEGMAKCVRRGLPTYTTPERAARAIQAMNQYASYLRDRKEGLGANHRFSI